MLYIATYISQRFVISDTSKVLKMISCMINDAPDNCAVSEESRKIVKRAFAIAKA